MIIARLRKQCASRVRRLKIAQMFFGTQKRACIFYENRIGRAVPSRSSGFSANSERAESNDDTAERRRTMAPPTPTPPLLSARVCDVYFSPGRPAKREERKKEEGNIRRPWATARGDVQPAPYIESEMKKTRSRIGPSEVQKNVQTLLFSRAAAGGLYTLYGRNCESKILIAPSALHLDSSRCFFPTELFFSGFNFFVHRAWFEINFVT